MGLCGDTRDYGGLYYRQLLLMSHILFLFSTKQSFKLLCMDMVDKNDKRLRKF